MQSRVRLGRELLEFGNLDGAAGYVHDREIYAQDSHTLAEEPGARRSAPLAAGAQDVFVEALAVDCIADRSAGNTAKAYKTTWTEDVPRQPECAHVRQGAPRCWMRT